MQIRFSPKHMRQFKRLAKASGQSVSAWVRDRLVSHLTPEPKIV